LEIKITTVYQMPIIRGSASDFTEFVKSNATLPTTGKASKSTNTAVMATANNKSGSINVASAVSIKASPITTIITTKVVTGKK